MLFNFCGLLEAIDVDRPPSAGDKYRWNDEWYEIVCFSWHITKGKNGNVACKVAELEPCEGWKERYRPAAKEVSVSVRPRRPGGYSIINRRGEQG